MKFLDFFIKPFKKYKITIDTGAFIIVSNPKNEARSGHTIVVERITDMPDNMYNPSIIVIDKNNKRIDVLPINNISHNSASDTMWKFIMPESDIKIVPLAHRKFRAYI